MLNAIELPQFLRDIIDFLKIDNIVLNFAGSGISALEIISTIIGLLCVFLAVRGKVANFWVGYIYNIVLFLLFLQKHLYSSMLLQPISLAINFFGHYRWTHPRENEKNGENRLKVTTYNNGQRAVIMGVVLTFMLIWGYFLSRVDIWFPAIFNKAQLPYLDAFVLGLVLTAQFLSAQKKLDCWYVWLLANSCNIVLCAMAGLKFLMIVYVAYFILAIGGLIMWRGQMKKEKEQEQRVKEQD